MDLEIKELKIIAVAWLISIVIHIIRFLQLVSPSFSVIEGHTPASLGDLLVRSFLVFLMAWSMLKLNLQWLGRWVDRQQSLKYWALWLCSNLLLSILFYHFFIAVYDLFFTPNIPTTERQELAIGWGFIILGIMLSSEIIKLQQRNRISLLEKEQLKQEKIASELMALRNQMKPHFLFNSFNALNAIIRKSPADATRFVDELSYMYRYILQSGKEQLLSIEKELLFLNSYIYLMKIRYQEKLIIEQDIPTAYQAIQLPPMSLQLLLENAIKHNEISKENPLIIKIFIDNEYLIVRNKIQKRSHSTSSTGLGLANIASQFKLLKKQDIIIQNDEYFTVKLPLAS